MLLVSHGTQGAPFLYHAFFDIVVLDRIDIQEVGTLHSRGSKVCTSKTTHLSSVQASRRALCIVHLHRRLLPMALGFGLVLTTLPAVTCFYDYGRLRLNYLKNRIRVRGSREQVTFRSKVWYILTQSQPKCVILLKIQNRGDRTRGWVGWGELELLSGVVANFDRVDHVYLFKNPVKMTKSQTSTKRLKLVLLKNMSQNMLVWMKGIYENFKRYPHPRWRGLI